MMKKSWLFATLIILTFLSVKVFAQSSSNKGKDFYLAYSAHIDALDSRFTLILSADVVTNYAVSIGNLVIATGTIAPNTSQQEVINPNSFSVYLSTSEVIETNKAIHVTTDKPISLYAIMAFNARTGGSMILPTNTLGKDYYAFSYQNASGSQYSQFTILATKDGTDVEITPTQTSKSGAHLANVKFTVRLNAGDIYQYQATNDLTGSYISSVGDCKPIALFSGNSYVAFCENGNPQTKPGGGDNLYQQIFPTSSWGKNFVTAPFYNTQHGNTDAFKIIVSDDNTVITVNGSTTDANGTVLNNPYSKGSVITFFSTGPNVVSATKPIALAHYQTSQNCNPNNAPKVIYPGDPEITLLNPIEQTLNDITVFSKLNSLSSVKTNIKIYYINVIIKTADIATFKMDGAGYNSSFVPIPNSLYSYAIIDVTNLQDQHRLISDGGFSAIAYGYGSFESYAYLAGANIKSFTFQTSNLADQSITSSCSNEAFKLKINLTAPALEIIWDLGDGLSKTVENPVAIETVKDDITYYTYNYPDDITYTVPGDHEFKVKVTYLNATNCGNTEEIASIFTIFEAPKTDFDLDAKICLGAEISPVDKSIAADAQITKWKWDFDGTIITDQKPKFTFTTEGTHTVTLSVGTQSGCWSDPLIKQIIVNPVPVSNFTAVAKTCIKTNVVFKDQSTINTTTFATAKITKWHWDFGDGNTDDRTDGLPFNYQYQTAGNFTVTLTTTSDEGCVSVVFPKMIEVTELPKANFTMPDICITDGTAKFTNTSVNVDGTVNGLTYLWAFGDTQAPGNATNSSTDRDGVHIYTKADDYSVTLTITNENGCDTTITQIFTVNGANPKADFKFSIGNTNCSNTPIIIENTSTVDFGKVTKLEVYKDFDNDPTNVETFMAPIPAEILLNYEPFGTPATKTYNVRVKAYSGIVCSDVMTKTVEVNSSPILNFDTVDPICENDGQIIIEQASEISGIPGTGFYSSDSKGLSSDGLFTPKVAGIGTHNITYTFNATNGCSSSLTQIITVNESPTADAGATLYMLAGGQITIPATARGNNLVYSWSPSAGLNKIDVLNPIASPEKDTEYTLVVTSDEECIAVTKVMVKVLQVLSPPNTFTPNGDGINDVWSIKYLDTYPNATVEVFNRNGSRVFFSNGYAVPFDGSYMNQPLPTGVYYYLISPRNGRKNISGPLTIIR